MASRYAFNITNFEYTQGVIVIPEFFHWYRAYDPDLEVLTENPSFFGDIEVAYLYATQKPNRKIGEFMNYMPLRVLDIRYLMSILPYVITQKTYDPIYQKLALAFGLCSFNKQIQLLKQLDEKDIQDNIERMEKLQTLENKPDWVNPIELQGVRIGITEIDYEVISWLKDLFNIVIDGFIAPQLNSPFYDQKYSDVSKSVMYEELILFNPKDTFRHVCDRPMTPRVKYYLQTGEFQQVLNTHPQMWKMDLKPMRVSRQYGGNRSVGSSLKQQGSDKIQTDSEFKKYIERMRKSWKRNIAKLKKSEPFLNKVYIPLKLVQPDS